MVVSADEAGMVEYWSGLKGDCKFPQNIDFQYKTDTDLFEFVMVSRNILHFIGSLFIAMEMYNLIMERIGKEKQLFSQSKNF